MKTTLALLFAVASTIAVAHEQGNAAAIGELMQSWQSRILALNLPVEDGKNWSMRNMAKFSRLNAERLALAQRAGSLAELELVLLDAPFHSGTRLDVLLANQPGNIAMMGSRPVAKSSPATAPAAYADLVFTAVTTCRILDSRVSQGGSGPWSAGSVNTVKVGPYATGYATGAGAQGGSATSCGLDTLAGPGQIAVIMAAVSTVGQSGPGYLTFFPQGAPNPGGASVSQYYQPGYVQTSFVLIPTDLVAAVTASAYSSASTEVIIDVVGYFIANAGGTNITLVNSTATVGNITKGANRFIHNFGSQNTFIGVGSGNFTMTGTFNAGSGTNTLQSSTTGSANTATGANALQLNSTGTQNTGTGTQALSVNTTGSFNTAHGMNALQSNTVGSNNTASGRNSLVFNTSGGNNTAFGDRALFSNTGSSNIAVGSSAGANLTTGSGNIHIGHPGFAAEIDTIRIGDGSQAATYISGIRGITTVNANSVAVLIDSSGQLGTINSSRNAKDDIADMDAASSALLKLRPVTFHYKSDQASARTLQYGLVAEEVERIYPGLVAHSADGRVETVMYQFLPPMLLNEVQKQQRTIEAQAAEIAALKGAVEKLMAR